MAFFRVSKKKTGSIFSSNHDQQTIKKNNTTMFPQSLHFAQYRFILRAETTIQLSYYKGSALRGAFGQEVKQMVCLQPPAHPRECPVCPLRRECPYGTTFENALPAGVEPLPGYASIPHPFVF